MGPIETAVAAHPLFCHQEFLEKLESYRNSPIGKRVSLLLQHLAIDPQRQHYKATRGENKGWRRSRLGGNHGSHFYAWWAPASAQPLRNGEGFGAAPEGSIVLRDIRHHDDHSLATPQELDAHYLSVNVNEIRGQDYGPAPWTQAQEKFAGARGRVRLLKGHPGSGKTTALLHAADLTGAEKTLYVTYSRDLASIARSYFDRFCSKAREFQVLTYPAFLRLITGSDAEVVPLAVSRKRFGADLSNYARSLGPWSGQTDALFDEFHAHLCGDALPVGVARFEHCGTPRVSDAKYRERRGRFIGDSAVNAALDVAARLEKMDTSRTLAERYFPELWQAWKAAKELLRGDDKGPGAFKGIGCVALDECQDLTPIEAFVLAMLSNVAKPSILVAGDEAQTVRPTDFEWGWFNDILHALASSPTEYKLTSNLRSPRRIALLVNRVWDLYGTLEKRDRPGGAGYVEVEDDATDQMLYCAAPIGDELSQLLRNLAGRAGLALISLDTAVPVGVPDDVKASVLTAAEVKGLDFHSVCVLDGGKHLQRISERPRVHTQDVEALRRRLAIDQLRVALSRPTERLIWLDIAPKPSVVQASLELLNSPVHAMVSQAVPAALLRALDEEELDLEERIQRCLQDARQLLDVKPDLAWSRAMLAVMLLGGGREVERVMDADLRERVQLTAAEISFVLGMRGAKMDASLGALNLFDEAEKLLDGDKHTRLRVMIHRLREISNAAHVERPSKLFLFAEHVVQSTTPIPQWMLTEIQPKLRGWVDQLESTVDVGHNAALLFPILRPFYEAIHFPDAAGRVRALRERTLQSLMKAKRYPDALSLLRIKSGEGLNAAERKTEATCLEKTGAYGAAAAIHRENGDLASAVDCYREVPDIVAAYELMRRMPEAHPAREAYDWMLQVKDVFAKRPANFNKVMLAAEKKSLESMLEQGLGVQRKGPVAKKVTAKKEAAKKVAAKQATKPKQNPWF